MIENATGLILRTRPLTETSLIIHWLTPHFGRIGTVARGARRHKSSFAGKLDLFYLADFSFNRSRSSDLHNLREVNLRQTHGAIREDFLKLQMAAYATAFIELATEAETPLPQIFELLQKFLDRLCEKNPAGQIIFSLELKLLRELGLSPDWSQSNLTDGTKKIATALAESDFSAVGNLKLTKPQIEELRQFLHGFLIFHLGKLPRGRAAALAVEN
jgi:DNA repair protein RecO (recombination protein O)